MRVRNNLPPHYPLAQQVHHHQGAAKSTLHQIQHRPTLHDDARLCWQGPTIQSRFCPFLKSFSNERNNFFCRDSPHHFPSLLRISMIMPSKFFASSLQRQNLFGGTMKLLEEISSVRSSSSQQVTDGKGNAGLPNVGMNCCARSRTIS